MILIILGFFLLLFGVFVFFKKNEGETEISILGVKLKSNNSAILLICLGSVLAAIGTSSYNAKQDEMMLPNSYNENTKFNKGEDFDNIQDTTSITPNIRNKYEELLIGTWEFSKVVSGDEALLKLFGNTSEAPQNIEFSINFEDLITYYRGGSYDQEGYLTILSKSPNNEIQEFKVKMLLSGEWKIIGNELNEKDTDGSITPANDLTRRTFQDKPLQLSDFDITIGSIQKAEILHLDESVITVRNKKTKDKITRVRKS